MFKSILEDIKASFDYGNMLTRLVIINIFVFVVTALLNAFAPTFYNANILPYIAIPGDLHLLLYRPWTIITHMFLHAGLWHLLINMVILYWFGNIAGDLLGDRKILPVYVMGGLIGAIFYLLAYQLSPFIGSYALGASAAALALVFTAVAIAPDYSVNLILLGPVRIKYIGLVILFLDIIGLSGNSNAGGHFAHIGGALFGFIFVYLLKQGIDLSSYFYKKEGYKRKLPTKLKVVHKARAGQPKFTKSQQQDLQSQVDDILDKINQKGYDSLTDEEKEILYKASKK